MKQISVWDIEADEIEKICDVNEVFEAEVIEALMDYVEDVKKNNGWK